MKCRPTFFAVLFGAGFFTYLVHESAHWLMGAAFGADMKFGLNAVKFLSVLTAGQKAWTDFAGPAITVVQGLVAFALVMKTGSQNAFAFLYCAAFMRVVAGFISIVMPNDEARLSTFLGLGQWTLPILVGGALVVLLWKASRTLQLTWKDQLLCYIVMSLTTALIVGLDRFVL